MTISQAKTVLYTEASRLRKSALSYVHTDGKKISTAIDTVCGSRAYQEGNLNKILSVYYADINSYARDLSYSPSNAEVADELLKLAIV